MAGDGRKKLTTAQAKEMILELIAKGHTLNEALPVIGRAQSSYFDWLKTDPEFKIRVSTLRETHRRGEKVPVPDFPEFCDKYLGQPLYWHQLQWYDLIEGRVPRDLHPSQTYEPGDPRFILLNCPPEHAKTSTLTVNYSTWRICKDPNIRILLVSKTQELSKQMLWAIKSRLTHPQYSKLQIDFGPPGGWKSDAEVWAADKIYLGADRDSKEKDPTISAIGMGGQTPGRRLDLCLVDDAVTLSNSHEFEKQVRWLQQEVLTRGHPMSILAVIGTRVDPTDLYSELRSPERYPGGEPPWTYLGQPAVLEFHDNVEQWVTLWPKAQEPWPGAMDPPDENGMFERWSPKYLKKRRGLLAPKTWALAYMQAGIAEDQTFREEVVRASINKRRQPGILNKDAVGHRPDGMEGLYVIGGMDPAMVGHTGVIVYAVDRHSKRRWVLQVLNMPRATPHWIRTTIKELTEIYGIHEWMIERNAFQAYLTQDPELRDWLGALGVNIREHTTGKNKWDVDFGVASMATVFENGFIELPATHMVEACKALVEQLITWAPETKNKTDLVMALWFCELRAREVIMGSSTVKGVQSFVPNRFLSRRAKQQQVIVNLNDLAIARR